MVKSGNRKTGYRNIQGVIGQLVPALVCQNSFHLRLGLKITIRLKGASKEGDGFGQIVEVAAPAAGELDLFKAKNGDKTNHELRIVEIEFKENLWQ